MAGQAGFEPATLGFGVRCSGQLELLTLRRGSGRRLADLGFLVQRVRATTRTKLLDLKLFGLLLFVPGCHVIAPFTAVARQSDYFPDCRHDRLLFPRANCASFPVFKAHGGNRTRDLFLTKEVLYRLSYMGPVSNFLIFLGLRLAPPPASPEALRRAGRSGFSAALRAPSG